MAQQPLLGQGVLIFEVSRSHADTPHRIGFLWTNDQPDQKPLPSDTQLSQETDLYTHAGIRTRNEFCYI